MKHAAIPTVYKDIRFRSRLEAKWACMFDLLGWSWEYEPIDLNGWIPDFIITNTKYIADSNKPSKPILAEIKPIFQINRKVVNKIEHSINAPSNENFECDTDEWETFCKQSPYDYMLFGAGLNKDVVVTRIDIKIGWHMQFMYGWFPFGLRISNIQLQLLWAHATNNIQWNAPK